MRGEVEMCDGWGVRRVMGGSEMYDGWGVGCVIGGG